MVKYEIIYDDAGIVKVKCGYLTFTVNKNLNALTHLSSSSNAWINAVIPHVLPSGHKISCIHAECMKGLPGKYNKLVISSGIQVLSEAFFDAKVHEVVWPDDCFVIPYGCFASSTLTKISNIQNVRVIEAHAFEYCDLREITWPSSCDKIPKYCFQGAKITKIENISHLKEIEECAFLYAEINHIDLSNTNISSLNKRSLAGLYKLRSVPPYYVSEEDWDNAFLRPC